MATGDDPQLAQAKALSLGLEGLAHGDDDLAHSSLGAAEQFEGVALGGAAESSDELGISPGQLPTQQQVFECLEVLRTDPATGLQRKRPSADEKACVVCYKLADDALLVPEESFFYDPFCKRWMCRSHCKRAHKNNFAVLAPPFHGQSRAAIVAWTRAAAAVAREHYACLVAAGETAPQLLPPELLPTPAAPPAAAAHGFVVPLPGVLPHTVQPQRPGRPLPAVRVFKSRPARFARRCPGTLACAPCYSRSTTVAPQTRPNVIAVAYGVENGPYGIVCETCGGVSQRALQVAILEAVAVGRGLRAEADARSPEQAAFDIVQSCGVPEALAHLGPRPPYRPCAEVTRARINAAAEFAAEQLAAVDAAAGADNAPAATAASAVASADATPQQLAPFCALEPMAESALDEAERAWLIVEADAMEQLDGGLRLLSPLATTAAWPPEAAAARRAVDLARRLKLGALKVWLHPETGARLPSYLAAVDAATKAGFKVLEVPASRDSVRTQVTATVSELPLSCMLGVGKGLNLFKAATTAAWPDQVGRGQWGSEERVALSTLAMGMSSFAPLLAELASRGVTASPQLALAAGVWAHKSGLGSATMTQALRSVRDAAAAGGGSPDECLHTAVTHLLAGMYKGTASLDLCAASAVVAALAAAKPGDIVSGAGSHVLAAESLLRCAGWGVKGKALTTLMRLFFTSARVPSVLLLPRSATRRDGISDAWRFDAGKLQASLVWCIDAARAVDRGLTLPTWDALERRADEVLSASTTTHRCLGLLDYFESLAHEYEPALRAAAEQCTDRVLGLRVAKCMDSYAASRAARTAAAREACRARLRATLESGGLRCMLLLLFSQGTRDGAISNAKLFGTSQSVKALAAHLVAQRGTAAALGEAVVVRVSRLMAVPATLTYSPQRRPRVFLSVLGLCAHRWTMSLANPQAFIRTWWFSTLRSDQTRLMPCCPLRRCKLCCVGRRWASNDRSIGLLFLI